MTGLNSLKWRTREESNPNSLPITGVWASLGLHRPQAPGMGEGRRGGGEGPAHIRSHCPSLPTTPASKRCCGACPETAGLTYPTLPAQAG